MHIACMNINIPEQTKTAWQDLKKTVSSSKKIVHEISRTVFNNPLTLPILLPLVTGQDMPNFNTFNFYSNSSFNDTTINPASGVFGLSIFAGSAIGCLLIGYCCMSCKKYCCSDEEYIIPNKDPIPNTFRQYNYGATVSPSVYYPKPAPACTNDNNDCTNDDNDTVSLDSRGGNSGGDDDSDS